MGVNKLLEKCITNGGSRLREKGEASTQKKNSLLGHGIEVKVMEEGGWVPGTSQLITWYGWELSKNQKQSNHSRRPITTGSDSSMNRSEFVAITGNLLKDAKWRDAKHGTCKSRETKLSRNFFGMSRFLAGRGCLVRDFFFEKDTRTPKGSPFSSRVREERRCVARSTSRVFPQLPRDGCALSPVWLELSRIFRFRTLVGFHLAFMHSAFYTKWRDKAKNWRRWFDNSKTLSRTRSPAKCAFYPNSIYGE